MADILQGQLTPKSSAVSEEQAILRTLVQLMVEERQEALNERKAKLESFREKERQRQINAEYQRKENERKQELCTHKKGGKGLKGPKVDYALGFHTFSDASSYIRCLICGAKWKNQDTDEYLVRRGERIPNPTGIGWKRAYAMLGESSNTPTSSEVQLKTSIPVAPAQEDFKANPRAVEI
jgi:hypothetical protein